MVFNVYDFQLDSSIFYLNFYFSFNRSSFESLQLLRRCFIYAKKDELEHPFLAITKVSSFFKLL